MSEQKHINFSRSIRNIVNNYNHYGIKRAIGDSVNNHRVPTVNQIVRFLTRRNASAKQRHVGKQLKNVYSVLRPKALEVARVENNRTDAMDINEFLFAYAVLVSVDQKVKSQVKKLI
jgi:hypothetical protein